MVTRFACGAIAKRFAIGWKGESMGESEPGPGAEEPEGTVPHGAEDPPGGPPAEHLRDFLRQRFGEVPPESPSETQDEPPDPDRGDRADEDEERDTAEAGEPL